MQLLARRNYSSHSLKGKLILFVQKEKIELSDEMLHEQIDQVILDCVTRGWVNDDDFLKRYLEERARKGYGPKRLVLDAMQKGFSKTAIESELEALNIDFLEILKKLMLKKWKKTAGSQLDMTEKQKSYAYLINKGFNSALIARYFNIDEERF